MPQKSKRTLLPWVSLSGVSDNDINLAKCLHGAIDSGLDGLSVDDVDNECDDLSFRDGLKNMFLGLVQDGLGA